MSGFGGNEVIWDVFILLVNFMILTVPVYNLVNNVRFLDSMIISGAKRIALREGASSEPGTIYQRFLELNTYLVVLLIIALIIIVTPNNIGLWLHFVVLGIAIVILLVMIFGKNRKKVTEPEETDSVDDDHGDDL